MTYVPTIHVCETNNQPDCFDPSNWCKYFIKVDSVSLEKPLSYKSCFVSGYLSFWIQFHFINPFHINFIFSLWQFDWWLGIVNFYWLQFFIHRLHPFWFLQCLSYIYWFNIYIESIVNKFTFIIDHISSFRRISYSLFVYVYLTYDFFLSNFFVSLTSWFII